MDAKRGVRPAGHPTDGPRIAFVRSRGWPSPFWSPRRGGRGALAPSSRERERASATVIYTDMLRPHQSPPARPSACVQPAAAGCLLVRSPEAWCLRSDHGAPGTARGKKTGPNDGPNHGLEQRRRRCDCERSTLNSICYGNGLVKTAPRVSQGIVSRPD